MPHYFSIPRSLCYFLSSPIINTRDFLEQLIQDIMNGDYAFLAMNGRSKICLQSLLNACLPRYKASVIYNAHPFPVLQDNDRFVPRPKKDISFLDWFSNTLNKSIVDLQLYRTQLIASNDHVDQITVILYQIKITIETNRTALQYVSTKIIPILISHLTSIKNQLTQSTENFNSKCDFHKSISDFVYICQDYVRICTDLSNLIQRLFVLNMNMRQTQNSMLNALIKEIVGSLEDEKVFFQQRICNELTMLLCSQFEQTFFQKLNMQTRIIGDNIKEQIRNGFVFLWIAVIIVVFVYVYFLWAIPILIPKHL